MTLEDLDEIRDKEYTSGFNKGQIEGFEKGKQFMLKQLNTPALPIVAKYNPAYCPTCKKDFDDYQECEDGIYSLPASLIRCPHCGQKLDWDFRKLIIF